MSDRKVLLTVLEVAERLGIGRTLAYELIRRGSIPSIKLGRSRRIPAAELDIFVKRQLHDGELDTAPVDSTTL